MSDEKPVDEVPADEVEDDVEEEEEEDDDEEEVIDPREAIEEKCKTTTCAKLAHELDACAKRIEGDESGEKHCTGQYFDFFHCVDNCVAPKVFKELK